MHVLTLLSGRTHFYLKVYFYNKLSKFSVLKLVAFSHRCFLLLIQETSSRKLKSAVLIDYGKEWKINDFGNPCHSQIEQRMCSWWGGGGGREIAQDYESLLVIHFYH